MAQSTMDIKIGCTGQQKQQLYSHVKVKIQLRKDKLSQICNQLCLITGTAQPPFIIMELPNIDFQQHFSELSQSTKFQFSQTTKANKLYFWANFKQQKNKKLSKNIQKSFKKLTQFSNSLSMQVKFYNIWQNLKFENGKLQLKAFDGFQMNGKAKLDHQFVTNLKSLIQKINPQFNNSPIITFLQLFEYGNLSLNLQSLEILDEDKQAQIFKFLRIEQKKYPMCVKLSQSKEDLKITLNIGKLFSVKISGCSKLMDLLYGLIW